MALINPEDDVKVILSKHWHKPEHEIMVGNQGFVITTKLVDIARALAHEVGSPAMLMTKEQLENKLVQAAGTVLQKIKEVSIHT
jgi:hypothetical protein